jgi:hypothetical protein
LQVTHPEMGERVSLSLSLSYPGDCAGFSGECLNA